MHLYWADAEGLLSIPIGGGAMSRLVRANDASQIGLDAHNVYFNAGPSGSLLFRMPKVGTGATLEAIASSKVTDLYIHEKAQTTLYWSEESAAVKSYVIGDSTPITYQPATQDRFATSVGFDGSRVLWIACWSFPANPHGGFGDPSCDVMGHEAGVTRRFVSGWNVGHPSYNQGASNLVFDTTQVFWSREDFPYAARGLMKYVYTLPPSVSIDPALITARRQGSGGLTRTASAVVSNGEPPYNYSWSIDNGFSVHNDVHTPDVSIYAALAACDTAEGTLFVTVTDAIGRSASASAEVVYTATRPPGGVCD